VIILGATVIHLVDGYNRKRGQVVTRCGHVYDLAELPTGGFRPDGQFSEKWLDTQRLTSNRGDPLCLCSHCRDRWPRRAPGTKRSAYRGRQ
jgi:hypothetical protein